jgi:uncharacterized membrane protein YcaP (DUF421 family)
MLFIVMRFLLQRRSGGLGMADVLVIVLIADATPPLMLIKDGQLLRYNMRAEMITTEELLSELRQQGLEDPAKVKCAFLEGTGELSILRREE